MRKSVKILGGCLAIPVLGFAALFVAFLLNYEPPTEEEKAAQAAKEAEMLEAAKHRYAQLATVYENLNAEDASKDAIACDHQAMATKLSKSPDQPLELPFFYSPYLKRFVDESAWNEDVGEWSWLVEEDLREAFRPVPELGRGELYTITRSAPYAAIFHPASVALNRMPELADGGFNGGIFLGTVQVVDVLSAQVVCRATLAVTSSDEIRPIFKRAADHALEQDFQANFTAAVEEALGGTVTVDFS